MMPAKLSAETHLERARQLVREIEALLAAEPTDPHAHGTWIVKLKSKIGHADRAHKAAFKLCYARQDRAIIDQRLEIDRTCAALWQATISKMNHGRRPG